MTMDDRIAAVAGLGFSERQARFLVHVMLFSGICLPRQYARSAAIAYRNTAALLTPDRTLPRRLRGLSKGTIAPHVLNPRLITATSH